ncbi:hypothetical protein F5Y03DRAFT_410198 [Xylaria venustula]|nr:hypothetical protein F5Y03DRAFT_410198 [Xylaria venustula]
MAFGLQELVHSHAQRMDAAFRSLVDTLIQNSRLNITVLRISSVTEEYATSLSLSVPCHAIPSLPPLSICSAASLTDEPPISSFHVSLDARLTNTGPATVKITSMTIDLCGPSGHFGKVLLPAITARRYGTDVVVTNQLVSIVDKDALKAFIQAIIKDDTVLSLRNGKTTVTALGIGPRDIVYEKEILLHGMRGPIVGIQEASLIVPGPSAGSPPTTANSGVVRSYTASSLSSTIGGGNVVSIVFRVANPSPLEISFGICDFNIQDDQGRLIAELKGLLDIRRDHFEVTFQGNVNKAVAAKLATDMEEARPTGGKHNGRYPNARLVGKRCAGAGWCDQTVKSINVQLQDISILFQALGLEDSVGKQRDRRGGFARWSGMNMLR